MMKFSGTADTTLFHAQQQGASTADNTMLMPNVAFCPSATGRPKGSFTVRAALNQSQQFAKECAEADLEATARVLLKQENQEAGVVRFMQLDIAVPIQIAGVARGEQYEWISWRGGGRLTG